MCPPVLLGACNDLVSAGVLACSSAPVEGSVASVKTHREVSRDINSTSRMCTQWMQEQQARSLEIEKTLADIRADFVALQTVPISSAETKSAISDWPLPVSAFSAGSTSHRRPSQTLNPG